jgi:hypothetical protein
MCQWEVMVIVAGEEGEFVTTLNRLKGGNPPVYEATTMASARSACHYTTNETIYWESVS